GRRQGCRRPGSRVPASRICPLRPSDDSSPGGEPHAGYHHAGAERRTPQPACARGGQPSTRSTSRDLARGKGLHPEDDDDEEEPAGLRVGSWRGRETGRRHGSALPGWGRQGRAPVSAAYFFFFLEAFFFFAIVSPPSRPARPAVGDCCGNSGGGSGDLSRGKYNGRGRAALSGATSWGRNAQFLSRAEEGRRCSRRFTNSWLRATPFLHMGHCSGGY